MSRRRCPMDGCEVTFSLRIFEMTSTLFCSKCYLPVALFARVKAAMSLAEMTLEAEPPHLTDGDWKRLARKALGRRKR